DVRGEFNFVKFKFCLSDLTVVRRMADLRAVQGSKAAGWKVEKAKETMEFFANRDDEVFCADGEPAEQLMPRLAKVGNVLPSLDASIRCFSHAAQASLESIVKSDEKMGYLMDRLVTRFADTHSRGSLARALKNSPKLASMFRSEVRLEPSVVSELSASSAMQSSFASQRWDSTVEALRLIVLRLNEILKFLCKVCLTDDNRDWALSVLQVFTWPNIIAMCLLVEFMSCVRQHIHSFDNQGGTRGSGSRQKNVNGNAVSRIVFASRRSRMVSEMLARLFDYEINGTKHKPLVLDRNFTHGYCQIAAEALKFGSQKSFSVVHKGRLLYRLYSHDLDLKCLIADGLGSIANMKRAYLQSVLSDHEAGLGEAFEPFDVTQWVETRDDKALSDVLRPLATVGKVEVEPLVKELLVARPTALAAIRRGCTDPEIFWPEVLRHWGRKTLPILNNLVPFMLSIWVSSSELEQDFSYLQLFQLKSRICETHLRDLLKVLLDGPSVSDLCPMSRSSDGKMQYTSTDMILRCQALYRKTFGTAKNQRKTPDLPRRKLSEKTAAPKGVQGFLRVRHDEITSLMKQQREASGSDQTLEQAGLEEITANSATKKATAKQQSLCKTMRDNQDKKRKALELLADGSDPHAEATLQACQQEMQAREVADLTRRDLQWSERNNCTLSFSCSCVLMPGIELSSDEQSLLAKLRIKTLAWKSDVEFFRELFQVKDLIWFTNGDEGQIVCQGGLRSACQSTGQTAGQTNNDDESDNKTPELERLPAFLMASRLVGGWVAGIEWLVECKRLGWKLQPVLRLARAVSVPRELHLHNSSEFSSMISQIVFVGCQIASANCLWSTRDSRKNLQLVCN
ncbi:unnamed protein product, partial [Symbiodinium sp. CCMP2592]